MHHNLTPCHVHQNTTKHSYLMSSRRLSIYFPLALCSLTPPETHVVVVPPGVPEVLPGSIIAGSIGSPNYFTLGFCHPANLSVGAFGLNVCLGRYVTDHATLILILVSVAALTHLHLCRCVEWT